MSLKLLMLNQLLVLLQLLSYRADPESEISLSVQKQGI